VAGSPAAEQAEVGAVRGFGHLGRGDVQQRDAGTGRCQAQRGVHAGPAAEVITNMLAQAAAGGAKPSVLAWHAASG
jgi:hypothetical protein